MSINTELIITGIDLIDLGTLVEALIALKSNMQGIFTMKYEVLHIIGQ